MPFDAASLSKEIMRHLGMLPDAVRSSEEVNVTAPTPKNDANKLLSDDQLLAITLGTAATPPTGGYTAPEFRNYSNLHAQNTSIIPRAWDSSRGPYGEEVDASRRYPNIVKALAQLKARFPYALANVDRIAVDPRGDNDTLGYTRHGYPGDSFGSAPTKPSIGLMHDYLADASAKSITGTLGHELAHAQQQMNFPGRVIPQSSYARNADALPEENAHDWLGGPHEQQAYSVGDAIARLLANVK